MIPSIEARRRGGRTRALAFDAAYQRRARSFVSREACVRSGRKGAQVTLERYGAAFLHERLRAWRLAHPSSLERRLIELLREAGQREGLDYAREHRPLPESRITVDFCWPDRRLVVEVDGPVHALFDEGGERFRLDELRRARLQAAGWRVVVLLPVDLEPDVVARLGLDRRAGREAA